MFCVGDLVVHPMHGAGVIADIVQERVAGATQDYYVFQMHVGGLLLKIPVTNSAAIGVRNIISATEAATLISAIPALTVEVNANWNKRYQENVSRLKSGDLTQVVQVIKSLMYRGSHRALSTGEWKMLHNAKQIIVSEVAMVENCSPQDVEKRLDALVMQKQEG